MRQYCSCEWNDKGSVLTPCAAHQAFEAKRCVGFEREIDRLCTTLQNITGHLPALRMIDAETRAALGGFAAIQPTRDEVAAAENALGFPSTT
jgi:hypothetical protein